MKLRILTALIGIPAAVYIITAGGWLFGAFVFLLAQVAWYEFWAMLKLKDLHVGYALGFLSISALLAFAWLGSAAGILAAAVLTLLAVLMKAVAAHAKFSVPDAAFTIMGIFYIGLPFAHFLLLRFTDQFQYITTSLGPISLGAMYIWLAFLGTWASDTCAYFVGVACGKHKLCPAISPKKTMEGAAGGLIGSILAVAGVGYACHFPLPPLLALGLLVGIFAPFGDLVESVLKRFAGVKDSGKIFPGHGGVLDRFDAMLFSVPVVYYYVNAFFR